jgi:hypothetical protein
MMPRRRKVQAIASDPNTSADPPVHASTGPHHHGRKLAMVIRAPNYYFEKIINDIQREIDATNPALILVNKADWDVIKANIPAHRYVLSQDADTQRAQLTTTDEYGWERTFQLVPPDEPPSGTLNLTARRPQEG